MLAFIPLECLDIVLRNDKEAVVYNMTALGKNVENIYNIGLTLLPNPEYLTMTYNEYIMNIDDVFCTMMHVVEKLFEGKNVYLLKSNNYIYDEALELFQRFIFSRYGYKSFIINNIEDLESTNSSEGSFNIIGVQNYDNDIIRYMSILHCKYEEASYQMNYTHGRR